MTPAGVTELDLLDIAPEARAAAAPAAAAAGADIDVIRRAADTCRACDLWERATQTVFGVGPVPARIMLVGEQPGDQEDRAGEPFVGPAGKMLDKALAEAGMSREQTFVTNVVKHFRWKPVPGTKRRLHERPSKVQVGACLPWVAAELEIVRPQALVLLGATAAAGLLGSDVRVTRDRGRPLPSNLAPHVFVTIHPSAILRAGEASSRADAFNGFRDDLAAVVRAITA
ncbi:MAG TPA: UdgX family uracil-DNA binding protein [Candidatus Acidoferrum sp.]|nr:UdgX family uracil-DNA binding protein [Candidatus Acidoferrum sp.]